MTISDYRTALVTGASSGIGEATVRALCAQGLETVALARRRDRLEGLADDTGCRILDLDLCDTAALYQALEGLEIDVLVNNAGVGPGTGQLLLVEPEDIDVTNATNVGGVLHATKALLPGMVARQRGHVLVVSSIAGIHPTGAVAYGGSKAAAHLICQNLRLELQGSGVRVTEICPGRVMSGFFEANLPNEEAIREASTGFTLMQPEDIAEAVVYAIAAPWRVNVACIELQATEQATGGVQIAPVAEVEEGVRWRD